jgi:predicted FMN-binding regulatory protein PaiB
MNPNIHAEVQRLKLHLQRYPEQSAQLAVNHLEDYLVLFSEYRLLQAQIRQLRQSNISKVSPNSIAEAQLTLEQRFRIDVFRRSLASELNQNRAKDLAIYYFQHFLSLAHSFAQKQAEFDFLQDYCDRFLLEVNYLPNHHPPQLPNLS